MAINERVNITVTSTGTVRVRKEIADVGTEARKASSGVDMLQNAIAGIVSLSAIGMLTKFADASTNITNRLKLVTRSSDELTAAQDRLYAISQKTYQSFEGTAIIFARTAQATAALGYSTQDALNFTEQLSKSVALSGVSAQSATQALVQLSQGLASGTLRGEELNSMLEQLPYATQTLAAGLGVTVGKLRELGQAGALTPQMIIDAFKRMSASVDADFALLVPTVSMGLQTISNGFIRLLQVMESNVGLFGVVGTGLALIGNNMEIIAIAVSPLIVALTAFGLQVLGGYVVSGALAGAAALANFAKMLATVALTLTSGVINALTLFTRGVWLLTAALYANPLVAFTAAVVAIGVAFLDAYGYLDSFYKFANEVIDALASRFEWLANAIREVLALFSRAESAAASGAAKPSAASGAAGALNKSANDNTKKAIEDGSKNGAKDINKGITDGGKTAGDSIKKAMESAKPKMPSGGGGGGGSAAPSSGSSTATGTKIGGLWKTGRMDIADFAQSTGLGVRGVRDTNVGQTTFTPLKNPNWGAGQNKTPGFANGGSMRVGGSGGTDSQMVQFKATPNEHVTVETPAQRRANNQNNEVNVPPAKVQVINQFDPRGSVDAMSTKAGREVTRNNIRADAEAIRRILGL